MFCKMSTDLHTNVHVCPLLFLSHMCNVTLNTKIKLKPTTSTQLLIVDSPLQTEWKGKIIHVLKDTKNRD